jgi:hypothetical protein
MEMSEKRENKRMKWSEMHVARMVGGIFFDRLAAFSSEQSRLSIADNILQVTKRVLDEQGVSPEIETVVGMNGCELKYDRKDTRHKIQLTSDGITFDLGKFRPAEHLFGEMAAILSGILGVTNRQLWNEMGTMIAVAIPSKKSEEKSRHMALFLKSFLLPDISPIARVFPSGEDRVIDITVKGKVDDCALALNVYNTDDQSLVCTLDSKAKRKDLPEPDIAAFLASALENYRSSCASFLETLSESSKVASFIDLDFLAKGER